MGEEEIWKVWEDKRKNHFNGCLWEVSNYGRIKKNGQLFTPKENRRYIRFNVWALHYVVAVLFVPNPDNKPCIDHIDGNKHNNRADNLRWVTHKENCNNPNTLHVRDRKWIHMNYEVTKFVRECELDKYLAEGWQLGRFNNINEIKDDKGKFIKRKAS